MSRSVAPYIHLDQEFLHALTLYGRVSGTERAVLDVVLLKTAAWRRHSHQVGLAEFQEYLPTVSMSGLQLAIRRLVTPADKKVRGSIGHGILVREAPHTPTQRTTWAVNYNWRTWGWTTDEHLAAAIPILTAYKQTLLPETWSAEAPQLASTLHDFIKALGGDDVRLPPVSLDDRIWRRWCTSMESIMQETHHPKVIESVIRWATENDHWGPRLCSMNADRILVDNFGELITRWKTQNKRTYM